ncbi:MAG: glycosyltransferase family 2 protein [Candidatus Dormibacteraceae bacterium]
MKELERMLSVMMPAYNEEATIEIILGHVLERPEVQEVIAVNDGSTDRTGEILDRIAAKDSRVRVFHQPSNQGKGAALRVAIEALQAPFALVQDADLEYDPRDYPHLLEPLIEGRADAVNGVRGFGSHTAYSYWFVKGNQWLTTSANMLFNCYLSDLLSGYKVMRSELWRRLNLTSTGFEVETEIMAKVVRLGYRFHETPITYITRSREEGKKIQLSDGFRILGTLARIRLSRLQRLFDGESLEYHRRRKAELASRHPLTD